MMIKIILAFFCFPIPAAGLINISRFEIQETMILPGDCIE